MKLLQRSKLPHPPPLKTKQNKTKKRSTLKMGMAAQVYNFSTKEVEAGELEDSLDYLEALPKKASTREMAQQLQACTLFRKDLSLVSSAQCGWLVTCNNNSKGLDAS